MKKVNSLKDNSTRAFALVGLILFILGVLSIPGIGLSFYAQPAILVMLGGIVLTAAFAIRSEVSQQSPNAEKAYVIFVSAAIMLVAVAIVVYMIVDVISVWGIVSVRGGGASPVQEVYGWYPIVHHVYQTLSILLILTSFVLVLNAYYLKSRML